MTKWKRLQQRKRGTLKDKYSESHLCVDCGYDTAPGCPTRAEADRLIDQYGRAELHYNSGSEVYDVHDHVWAAAGMEEWGGCLCIGCLEKRIGRRLTPDDFPKDHVFNTTLPGTQRLLERQGRYDPLKGGVRR